MISNILILPEESGMAVACLEPVLNHWFQLLLTMFSVNYFFYMNEEISYRVIKLIEQNPEISQRQLAVELGVSLGKTNYCLKELIGKGLIKASSFKNSNNKLAYSYMLTPRGIKEKVRITASFLKHKLAEFDALKNEIKTLKREVAQPPSSSES